MSMMEEEYRKYIESDEALEFVLVFTVVDRVY